MSDVDDELLALAGESSEEEDEALTTQSNKHTARSPQHSMSEPSAKKSAGKKSGKRNNDSEEEGEASSNHSSPTSQRSAPMDESDSDTEMPPNFDDDGEKYPLEGRFRSAADKAEIMAMPEIKREELLAERAQEIEKESQHKLLRQLLNAREAESKKNDKKRKAGTADLEDQRKTSRQRTKIGGGKVGEASSGIDNLKRARAEKTDRIRRRDEDKERNKGRRDAHDDYSDDDRDGDSEVDWDDSRNKSKKSKSPEYRDAEPAGLHDIERARVGRSRFAMVCFYPGFDEAITGCYVRISIGVDKQNGQNIYRMAVIKGFVEDRPYAMETSNGKHFKTTQYVRAAHGKAERNWPFITCSDSPFTEAEWNRLKQTCLAEGVPLPTKPKLINKITDINNLVNRSWTEEELQAKLTKSGALVNKFQPILRNQLTNSLKEARAANNTEKIARLEQELLDLEGPKLAYHTSMQPSPRKSGPGSGGLSQQERLAVLNRENRRKNADDVRQAQIAERRAARSVEKAIARGEVVAEDHSRRVKTRAKFKHDAGEGKKVVVVAEEGGAGAESVVSAVNTPVMGPKKVLSAALAMRKDAKGMPTFRRPLMDDDIIGAIDLGIDIEI